MEVPFYSNIQEDLKLIETFLWDPDEGAPDIDFHLERMCKSATKLKFKFSVNKIYEKISKIKSQTRLRCRLTLRMPSDKPASRRDNFHFPSEDYLCLMCIWTSLLWL